MNRGLESENRFQALLPTTVGSPEYGNLHLSSDSFHFILRGGNSFNQLQRNLWLCADVTNLELETCGTRGLCESLAAILALCSQNECPTHGSTDTVRTLMDKAPEKSSATSVGVLNMHTVSVESHAMHTLCECEKTRLGMCFPDTLHPLCISLYHM